jgi:hypothetical protein
MTPQSKKVVRWMLAGLAAASVALVVAAADIRPPDPQGKIATALVRPGP